MTLISLEGLWSALGARFSVFGRAPRTVRFHGQISFTKDGMDLPLAWKVGLRRRIPWPLVNAVLFRFPRLYQTRLVGYESHIPQAGLQELLAQLDLVGDLRGDIVECGSAHCGTSIVMARHAVSRGMHKRVFACDSYEGFDQVELARERAEGLTASGVTADAFTSTSYNYVVRKLAALGLERSVIPIRGFFKDTLPDLPGPFSLALIDCDLRDSLLFAAQTVWPRLVPRGRLLFDDYTNPAAKGSREGVDLFVESHRSEIHSHGLLGRLYHAVKV